MVMAALSAALKLILYVGKMQVVIAQVLIVLL